MSDFKQTTFRFTTEEASPLQITYVMTYGAQKEWIQMPQGNPAQGRQNQGIQYLQISNKTISQSSNGILTVEIDPTIVNDVPYASDKASLLISVNGSNLHIDIHKGGGMKTTGTYGNESVKFDCDFNDVGNLTSIKCSLTS